MNKYFLVISLFFITIITAQENSRFGFQTSIGLTYNNTSQHENDFENMEWLLMLQGFYNYAGEKFDFDSDFFVQYGQLVQANSSPQKTQDNLTVNLMPSFEIIESPSTRLFWQTKIETQLKEGNIDQQKTEFFDPGFLTHTLFIGNKNYLLSQADEHNLTIVYGIGYSFQQIIKNEFQLRSESVPSSSAEYSDGPTAVLNFTFFQKFTELTSINISFSSLLLAKKDFFKSTTNSRFSSLMLTSLEIGIVSLQYTNRIIYDKELSVKRQLDQSLVFGLKFEF